MVSKKEEEEAVPPTYRVDFAEAIYCYTCEIWTNGPRQWEDHRILRKQRRKERRKNKDPEKKKKEEAKDKGIVISKGTVLLIEQSALHEDAVKNYIPSLYNRVLLRARL